MADQIPVNNKTEEIVNVMDLEFDDLFESPGLVPSLKKIKPTKEIANDAETNKETEKETTKIKEIETEVEEKKKNKKTIKKEKKSTNIIHDEETVSTNLDANLDENNNKVKDGSKEMIETKMKPREKKKNNQPDNTENTNDNNDKKEEEGKKDKRKKKDKEKDKEDKKKTDNEEDDVVTKKKEKKAKKEKKEEDDVKKENKKEKPGKRSKSKSKSKNKSSNNSKSENDNVNESGGGDEIISQLILSTDEEKKVLKYMLQQNRPYSVINLFDNLRGSIKKKLLESTLNSLVEKEYIIGKQYNSMVYLVNQKLFPPINEVEVKKLNDKISSLEKSITDAQEKSNKLTNELKHVKTQYTDKELDELIASLKEKIKTKKERINKFKSNATEKIPEEKMLELKKKYDENVKNFKKIRKTVFDIADTFSEGFEISRKEFMENYGLDDDKDLVNNLLLPLK